jgi:hypothetical protein
MRRIFFNFYFLFSLAFSASCVPTDTINDNFNEKYAKELEPLKKQRGNLSQNQAQGFFSTKPTLDEINANDPSYQPYQNISKFGQNNLNQNNFFRGENYYPDATSISARPANIFDLNYQLTIHPGFRKAGIEFDNIVIPQTDAYGIASAMSDKQYFSPGGKLLKNSIDEILAKKQDFDNQNSEILVGEKQQILRKKLMDKTFTQKQEIVVVEEKEEEKKTAKEKEIKPNQNQNKVNSGFSIRAVK